MVWWLWLVIGLVLVGVELLTPGGFYVIFFGVAAIVVGALVGIGAADVAWVQWLLFSVLSVVSLSLFRKPLMRRFHFSDAGPPVDAIVGETCTVVQPPGADGYGKVELRGTTWTARTIGGTFAVGQRCRVERVDGLTVWIGPSGGAS